MFIFISIFLTTDFLNIFIAKHTTPPPPADVELNFYILRKSLDFFGCIQDIGLDENKILFNRNILLLYYSRRSSATEISLVEKVGKAKIC
jgi:hypothetical protein